MEATYQTKCCEQQYQKTDPQGMQHNFAHYQETTAVAVYDTYLQKINILFFL